MRYDLFVLFRDFIYLVWYSDTPSLTFLLRMSGILNTVRRTLSMGRQQSPVREDPSSPNPVDPSLQYGEQRTTLNPEQVAALLRGGTGSAAMSGEAKAEFAQKVQTLIAKGYDVSVEAVWGHQGDAVRDTVTGNVRLKSDGSGTMEAVWTDDPGMAYDFPFPDIEYYSLEIVRVRAKMPGGRKADEEPKTPNAPITDPARFTANDPLTWGPWLESEDELRVRDLIRDLRAHPEFGLLLNAPPIRERLFKIVQEWIQAARIYPFWREEHFMEIVRTAIEELRNNYWASSGIQVERVQLKLHKDDETKDAYSKAVAEEKLRNMTVSKQSTNRPAFLCYRCHKPGHFRANCPLNQSSTRLTPGFRGGVTSGTSSAKRSH